MFEKLSEFFSSNGYMPHGHCYLWQPNLVWTMVSSDFLIATSYVVISICLYMLVRKIKLPMSGMFLAFGTFIAACGATHYMEIYNLWIPNYWLAALVKIVTAIASVATAIFLYPAIPQVIKIVKSGRESEQRRLKLEDLTTQLKRQTIALEASNKELEEFCYAVSHDLRAPIRSMMGFSGALKEEYENTLDAQALEYLNKTIEASKKMGRLIDALLSLSKLSRVDLARESLDLTEMAEQISEELKHSQPTRHVDFSIEKNLKAVGDPSLIQSALMNLMDNAWKFTSKKDNAKIEFGHQEKDGHIVYYVRDNGDGFDMRYADKLFGTFQRLHSTQDYEGNGIGLATVNKIIRRHGGQIWADAKIKEGATFYFTL